jgi:tetratricopeptide (TPR) repeat protein
MFTDPDTAAANFERAAGLQPDYVPAQMLLVEILLAGGQTSRAQHRLEQDLPVSIQNHPWVAWQKSRLACVLGKFSQSEQLLEQLRSQGITSKSLLRQLLMVRHRTQKDVDLKPLTDELAACPQELLVWECPVLQEVRAEKLDYQNVLNSAQACLAKNDFRGALDVFRKAMESDPESPELMFNLAQLWMQAGDLDRADGILQVAETFERGSLRILLLRSRIAVMNRKWSSAKDLCEQAISLKPDSAEAWYVMAVMQNEQKQLDAAKESVNHALRLDPMHPDARRLSRELGSPSSK